MDWIYPLTLRTCFVLLYQIHRLYMYNVNPSSGWLFRALSPGGGVLPYDFECILSIMAANGPPFSAVKFVLKHIISQITKNPFRSITILHFLADFAVPETIIFKTTVISTRSSPDIAAAQRVRQRRGLTSVRRFALRSAAPRVSGRSGDSHFQAFGIAAD